MPLNEIRGSLPYLAGFKCLQQKSPSIYQLFLERSGQAQMCTHKKEEENWKLQHKLPLLASCSLLQCAYFLACFMLSCLYAFLPALGPVCSRQRKACKVQTANRKLQLPCIPKVCSFRLTLFSMQCIEHNDDWSCQTCGTYFSSFCLALPYLALPFHTLPTLKVRPSDWVLYAETTKCRFLIHTVVVVHLIHVSIADTTSAPFNSSRLFSSSFWYSLKAVKSECLEGLDGPVRRISS